jgi:hypothetical protein
MMTLQKAYLCVLATTLIYGGGVAGAQTVPARIYIDGAISGDPGFGIYLTAAIQAKHVNVVVTTDKTKADYILEQTSDHMKRAGFYGSIIDDWTAPALPQEVHGNDSASILLVDVRTSDVVFAYSVDRNNSFHGRQTAAESCAKHLKEAASRLVRGGGATVGSPVNPTATTADKFAAWPWKAKPHMGFGIY